MRTYKKKAYAENDKIKLTNRDYYYKYQYDLSADDMIRNKGQLKSIAKLRLLLKELDKDTNHEFMKQLLKEYN